MANTFTAWQITHLVHFHGAAYPLVADLIENCAGGHVADDEDEMAHLHAKALSLIMAADHLVYADKALRAEDFDSNALETMHLITAHVWELENRITVGDLQVKAFQRAIVLDAITGMDAYLLESMLASQNIRYEKCMSERARIGWIEKAMRARTRPLDMDELPTFLWDGSETVRLRSFAEINLYEAAHRTGISEADLDAFKWNQAIPTKEQWQLMIEANYMDAAVTRAHAA